MTFWLMNELLISCCIIYFHLHVPMWISFSFRPRWVVPVLPKGELEVLLDVSIDLCKKSIDTRSEACQRFFREGLTVSFTKILTDEAVSGWKYEIHVSSHIRIKMKYISRKVVKKM